MTGNQLRKLEAELWRAADQLRANSKLTASEYSMPVLGLIFLRHAFNRFEKVREEIEKNLPVHPQRGKRKVTPKDFEEKSAMFLPDESRFDFLVGLPEANDLGEAIDNAMKAIEEINPKLIGILPKNYSIFSKDLLQELLRIFNKEVLQQAEGDVFGKIYEYFLNKFAMTGAQEGGDFFTPFSLVNTIVNVIEPEHGIVFDPFSGSAGMFVQTGYFIEGEGLRPAEKVTFYGQEKAETNTKLAKMNLAVHGLEGNIQEGNTFYEDKHDLTGRCDFVMANPPFNVDGVDKAKDVVKKDPRLPFGLPKNDNANYLCIQYFYSYLKPKGRAGFVMASSASDAGHSEKDIREKLVKTGAVDVMMAIGNNFFYTRSLPCTLWFFDRGKEYLTPTLSLKKGEGEKTLRNKNTVLMLDARKIYHKVTQKINDFSPEQLQNLICIVNLYRGNTKKFTNTVQNYLDTAASRAKETAVVLLQLQTATQTLHKKVLDFAKAFAKEKLSEPGLNDLQNNMTNSFVKSFTEMNEEAKTIYKQQNGLIAAIQKLKNHDNHLITEITVQTKALRKPQDKFLKQLTDAIAAMSKSVRAENFLLQQWKELKLKEQLDQLKQLQQQLSGNPDEDEPGLLHEVEYFYKQAHWLTSRFPDGKYVDVEGLCKVVTQEEIEQKDWSLSPGRYVGVDAAVDDGIDYEERLNEIHIELDGFNEETRQLANPISEKYKQIQ